MRVHEVLISMALGAILFAPIATTAENTGSPSSGIHPSVTVRPPFNGPVITQQQRDQMQKIASCPTGCPLDPAITQMQSQISALQQQNSAMQHQIDDIQLGLNKLILKVSIDVQDQITAQQTQQDQTKKDLADLTAKYVAFKMQSVTQAALLDTNYKQHVHVGFLPAFGTEKAPLWKCDQDSCVLQSGTMTVVTLAKGADFKNYQTSGPIAPLK